MALIVADRVQETTNSTGTGAYTLGGAVAGFQAFSAEVSNADTVYYSVTDNADFEVGLGTYASSGGTITRTTVFTSSNSNNAVNWGIGTKNIFLTYPADKAVLEDASNNVTIGNNLVVGGTVDGRDVAADGTKLDFVTVTQAVDLDQMETDIAALANGMVYKGDWNAGSGSFPGGGSAQTGWFYYVSGAGTVNGISFTVGDNIVATTDNASTSTYASNWSKHDQTDAVQAVVGLTGSVSKSALLSALNVEDGADVTDTTNVTSAGALMRSGGAMTGDIDGAGNKMLFANVYSTTGDLPSASTYHGMFAHVHGTGKGYFAHAGAWVPLANETATLALSGGAMTGAITTNSTFDGRDVATDGTKLDGIEAGANVTDTANVTSAGALMDSEVTNLAQVKAFDSSDYATAAQGTKADAALPKAGGAMTGAITTNSTFDGRDVATDGTKLDGIESGADQTDTANVTSAGALMDSEVTNLAQVKAFDSSEYATAAQGTTADNALPKAGGTMTGNIAHASSFTLDVGGDITLDADGGYIWFNDNGTTVGYLKNESTDLAINVHNQDRDMFFKGNDGGSTITALTLDMSNAGRATFNENIVVTGTVDGRDVASDGSKLDGIASGATNVTNNNQLTNGAGYITSYVNTTYSAGSGLDLSGTTFSIESDLRGEAWTIGPNANDYISVESTYIQFVLDGAEDMRLENDGDLHVEGNVVAYSTTVSDERLKKDIVKIDNALDKVSQLNGYTFEYLADGKKSAGVIAQEVEKVMPSAITESTLPLKMGDDDETEYKTVQYDQLHGLMIEAIKELKAEIEELKAR